MENVNDKDNYSLQLRKIEKLLDVENFDEALEAIEILEKRLISPSLLVTKGRCVQLLSNTKKYELKDAERFFKQALEIDRNNIDALLELGWYNYNVIEKPDEASKYFEKAISLCNEKLLDAIAGKSKSIAEARSIKEAIEFLKSIPFIDKNTIDELKDGF